MTASPDPGGYERLLGEEASFVAGRDRAVGRFMGPVFSSAFVMPAGRRRDQR